MFRQGRNFKQMKNITKGLLFAGIIFMLIVFYGCLLPGQNNSTLRESNKSVQMTYEYVGPAVQKKNAHVWGSTPVMGKDGRVHLFVAEWPVKSDSIKKFSGWYTESGIMHYVANQPEGPFEFAGIAVADQDGDFNAPHNPSVKYMDDKYVLCFIVNDNGNAGADVREGEITKSQRIIMFVTDDLNDEWRPAKGAEPDGTVLRQPGDTSIWCAYSCRGVTNPSLVKHNGEYLLYFKSVIPDPKDPENFSGWSFGYGLAKSKYLEGPYQFHKKRITSDKLQLEDAAAFTCLDHVYMLSRDIRGTLGSREGGILWRSTDGYTFPLSEAGRSFEPLVTYVGEDKLKGAVVHRGTTKGQLERPQILSIDGKPAYMYVATGVSTNEGFGSSSHVFKLNIRNK